MCEQLVELSLCDNPIAKPADYRRYVSEIIPNLMILDGMSVGNIHSKSAEKISSSEFSSSLNSSLSRDSKNGMCEVSSHVIIDSLSSLERNSETVVNICNRPSTAGTRLINEN